MRVAVVGAGIAGLTAAIALARRGFAVELFERAAHLAEIGAGIQLSPNAFAVLERLGVAAELAGHVTEPEAIEIGDARTGARLARIPLGGTARSRYGAPYGLIHRGDLQAILFAAARREGVSIRLGAEVQKASQTTAGVLVRIGNSEIAADVLVAADGVHSRLRTGLFGYQGAIPLGRTAWRASLVSAMVPEGVKMNVTRLWLGPGAHLVHYPVEAGHSLNVVVIAADNPSAEPLLEPFGAALRPLFDAAPNWTRWPLSHVDATRSWVHGRAVLIGDAAHAMAPSAAQGGAMAIEDAWVLAQSLAALSRGPGEALAHYERQRRKRVERVARAALRNLQIYELAGAPAFARNLVIHALPAKTHLSRLDWLFDWKPA